MRDIVLDMQRLVFSIDGCETMVRKMMIFHHLRRNVIHCWPWLSNRVVSEEDETHVSDDGCTVNKIYPNFMKE